MTISKLRLRTVIAILLLIGGVIRAFTSVIQGVALCMVGLIIVFAAKRRATETMKKRESRN
jgi:hypothetical protein